MPEAPESLTWKMRRQLLKFFAPSIEEHPDWPVIVSEGDSWFSFPIHPSVIDHLDEFARREISLLRLERSGDKALRIIGGPQKERLAGLLARFPVQALLFSGGGNDFMGADLLPLLNERKPGMTWKHCINQMTAGARFDRLRSAFLDLVHLRDEARPSCRIYIHGYDWAIPSGRGARLWGIRVGPWMKPCLERKGITDPDDQREIIRWLLGRFSAMLARIAEQPNVVLVETLGTLAEGEWNDELHPSREGFEKIAGKFRRVLKKQFPATF